MITINWAGLFALVKKYGPSILPAILALLSEPPKTATAGPQVTEDDFRAECTKQGCAPAEVDAVITACKK